MHSFTKGYGARSGVALLATAALAVPLLLGCPGYVPDAGPGRSVPIDRGALAVDPRTETTFVLRSSSPDGRGAVERSVIFGVSADGSTVREVLDLGPLGEASVLFPSSGLLIMASESSEDPRAVAFLLDPDTFEVRASAAIPGRPFDASTSADGDFVLITSPWTTAASILDAQTLEVRAAPARTWHWLHGGAQLFGLSVADGRTKYDVWDLHAVMERGWIDPLIAGESARHLSAYTAIAIAPDDRRVAIAGYEDRAYGLLVLDLLDGSSRWVADALGSVTFTADGASLVTLRLLQPATESTPASEVRILVIDVESLGVRELDPPGDAIPTFVTSQGHWVMVVLHAAGESSSVLYDVNAGEVRMLSGSLTASASVTRAGELWIVRRGGLMRVPLMSEPATFAPLTFQPAHMSWLSRRDRLVMDDAGDPTVLRFFDPELEAVTEIAVLPAVP